MTSTPLIPQVVVRESTVLTAIACVSATMEEAAMWKLGCVCATLVMSAPPATNDALRIATGRTAQSCVCVKTARVATSALAGASVRQATLESFARRVSTCSVGEEMRYVLFVFPGLICVHDGLINLSVLSQES